MPEKTNKAGNLKEKLLKYEISFYFVIWISILIYSCCSYYNYQYDVYNHFFLDVFNDLGDGWFWVDRRVDISDVEWSNGMNIMNLTFPILFLHLMVSEFIKKLNYPKILPIWHIITSSVFIASQFSPLTLFILCLPPIIFYYFVQFQSKSLLWVCSVVMMIVTHYTLKFLEEYMDTTKENELVTHFTTVAIAWINLKCLSYFLDALTDEKLSKFNCRNLTNIIGYCLYLPLLYFGPIILYSDFTSSDWSIKDKKQRVSFKERGRKLLKNLVRFVFWALLTQLFLHYFYVTAFPYQMSNFKTKIDDWSLYGFGYLMGQYFHMKYVVFYGLSTCITQFELEIPVPRTPKCIARIHLYSEMWKYFDGGLYKFLVHYIYKPVAIYYGKHVASLTTFLFIYGWHGMHLYLLIWSALNYLGIELEALCSKIIQWDDFRQHFWDIIGDNSKRRISCLVASPLCIMSALSNFYFFAGKDIGDVFVFRFLTSSSSTIITIIFIIYCASQVSTEIQLMEDKFAKKHKINLMEKTMDYEKQYSRGDYDHNMTGAFGDEVTYPYLRKKHRSKSLASQYETVSDVGAFPTMQKQYKKLIMKMGLVHSVDDIYTKKDMIRVNINRLKHRPKSITSHEKLNKLVRIKQREQNPHKFVIRSKDVKHQKMTDSNIGDGEVN